MNPWGRHREVERPKQIAEPTKAQLGGKKHGLALLIQSPASPGDEWDVWISLPGEHPILDPFGFICGVGSTRDAAVAAAVAALEEAVERLQSPRGIVFEEKRRTVG